MRVMTEESFPAVEIRLLEELRGRRLGLATDEDELPTALLPGVILPG